MIYLDKSTDQQPVYIPKDEYTGTPGGHTTAILQSKDWEITHNGITRVSPDAGYDGVSGGTITVYVNSDTATTFEHLTVEENGEYVAGDAMAYSAVTVNVPTEPSIVTTSLTVTENGEYVSEPGEAYTGVTVNVPTGSTINNQTKSVTITENTSTTITFDAGYTGLEQVDLNINVPGGEIHNQDKSVTITQDIGQGTNYISASTVVTADTGYTGLGTVSVGVAIPCLNSINAGTYSENGQYLITGESMGFPGRPFRQVIFNVNVPSTSTTVTAITATENNRRYLPSNYGVNAFSEVTVQVDTTPYYNSGYTEGWQDGYNGVVTSWDQVSGATSLVYTSTTIGERWSLSKLKGVYPGDTAYDTYPYYAQLDGATAHLLSATTIYQEMPEAEDLSNFMYNCHRSISIAILNATQLSSLYSAFAFSSVDSVTINATRPAISGGCSFYHAFRSSEINNPSITAYTTSLYGCFAGCTNLTTLENTRFYPAMDMDVESMCDGCSSLHTIPEWDWSAVRRIETGYQPFKGCTALSTLGGFSGLGESFETSYSGHTLSLVDCTNPYDSAAVTQSLTNVISKLGTVPAEVTDATVLINSTWAGLVGSTTLLALQTVAAGKNWQLTVA